MECISCQTEINPKWTHAVQSNICPFCGESILQNELVSLLSSLRANLDALAPFQEQLNDWLLSNFSYIKTDSPHLMNYLPSQVLEELTSNIRKNEDLSKFKDGKKFTVKVKTDLGEEEIVAEKIQSDKITNDFFKRAEVKLNNEDASGPKKFSSVSEKQEHLRNLANKIKNGETTSVIDESGLSNLITSEMIENSETLDVSDFTENNYVASAMTPDYDDEIPAVVQRMASNARKNSNPNADLEKLQKMQSRVKESARNLAEGKGAFSRT